MLKMSAIKQKYGSNVLRNSNRFSHSLKQTYPTKEWTTITVEYKKVQVWHHLTTVHQIGTKDSKRRCCYTKSVVVLNSFWINLKKIVKKRKKIKKGGQDDNTIAQTAASSLLALVNGLDESNKFNQQDEMQNHMSKLITEQKGKVMDDYVVEKQAKEEHSEKKNKFSQYRRFNWFFKLIRRQKKDTA
jgi:hypothetical protein